MVDEERERLQRELDDERVRLRRQIDAWHEERTADMDAEMERVASRAGARQWFVPPAERRQVDADQPFMEYSTCSYGDFQHPRFTDLCATIGHENRLHRKLWEFVFILHQLERAGALAPGARGLGFGVGQEPLPARFAALGCDVVATDAPPEIGADSGWHDTSQWAFGVDALPHQGLCDLTEFRERVTYRPADMNRIDADLTGFDFTWSACCFEHLGSIRHGLDFVINSVENCLRPGGVAIHTTEFNLSSNDVTVESAHLSLFRRRDLEELVEELRRRGHDAEPITIAPDANLFDHFVDLPPFNEEPHLKLELEGLTCTSVGLVVRRGA